MFILCDLFIRDNNYNCNEIVNIIYESKLRPDFEVCKKMSTQ